VAAGSGTAARPGAVICPPPEKETGVGSVVLSGPDGDAVPVELPDPLAPLKIPVPPLIVRVLENVGNPMPFRGPNKTEFVPVKVSAPALKEAVKLFSAEAGTNTPGRIMAYVMLPVSE
jgi:hypothetical protein